MENTSLPQLRPPPDYVVNYVNRMHAKNKNIQLETMSNPQNERKGVASNLQQRQTNRSASFTSWSIEDDPILQFLKQRHLNAKGENITQSRTVQNSWPKQDQGVYSQSANQKDELGIYSSRKEDYQQQQQHDLEMKRTPKKMNRANPSSHDWTTPSRDWKTSSRLGWMGTKQTHGQHQNQNRDEQVEKCTCGAMDRVRELESELMEAKQIRKRLVETIAALVGGKDRLLNLIETPPMPADRNAREQLLGPSSSVKFREEPKPNVANHGQNHMVHGKNRIVPPPPPPYPPPPSYPPPPEDNNFIQRPTSGIKLPKTSVGIALKAIPSPTRHLTRTDSGRRVTFHPETASNKEESLNKVHLKSSVAHRSRASQSATRAAVDFDWEPEF